jgi:hypothetical protein
MGYTKDKRGSLNDDSKIVEFTRATHGVELILELLSVFIGSDKSVVTVGEHKLNDGVLT